MSKKAKCSNSFLDLKRDFSLNANQLRKVFLVLAAYAEVYVKAFQCKVLNSILYTNYRR